MPVSIIPPKIARIPTSIPKGVGWGGVLVEAGTGVITGVAGRGLVAGIDDVEGIVVNVGKSGEGVVVGVDGIRSGTSRSRKTLADDCGFSALMENVRVAVLKEVWKATTARPSRSVVRRA
ncbi:MAG: hypothetical protein LUQ05_07455 [Methanoregula sp.]|nr:hypothetical protein [Methanoregula sp.]